MPITPNDPGDDDTYLDLREEWDPAATAAGEPPTSTTAEPAARTVAADAAAAAPLDAMPTHVRGVARTVVAREHSEHGHVLELRVDRYDASGNRVAPVPVRMTHHRSGQVADGDEVELRGKWVHGTLETREIANLTTGAQVHGGLPSAKPLAIGCGAIVALALLVLGALFLLNRGDADAPPAATATVVVPEVAGLDGGSASATVREAGLVTRIRTERSETVQPGTVVRSEPAAGTTVDRGSTVVLYVSTGTL